MGRNRRSPVEWRRATGPAVLAGGYRITPECQALVVRLPIGALVRNRAVAVTVERDGQVRRVRIPDVAGIAPVVLFGLALGAWLLARRGPIPHREDAA